MTKDASILRFLDRLFRTLDPKTWTVVDHWDADLFAIGIARVGDPKWLVYVSTHGQAEGLFAFECEIPDGNEGGFKVVSRGEAVNFDALVSAISKHL